MQGILLSEKVLREQICSVCKNYLSHGPIKITTKEGVKCGRCNVESDIGVISCINSVFESVIFPCVNRYEGCLQLLRFQDVPKHEETCIGGQYPCLLCPEEQYGYNSLLWLLNHYRNVHKSEIISEPCIIVDIKARKEHIYIYCSDLETLIFINIKFNGEKLSIIPSKIIEDLNNVKFNVSIVEDGCQKYNSSGEVCGVNGLNFNALEVDLETLLLKNCTTVQCIFNFDVFTALKVISLPNIKSNCIESYGHSHNNNHPTCPKKAPVPYFYNREGIYYNKRCNLCENYFSTCGHIKIYVCSGKFICGVCFYNGIINCDIGATIDHYNSFYCRYECKKSFNVSELIMHEKQCLLNTEEHLDDKTFGMLHFGNYFCINSDDAKSLIVRSNLVTYNLDVFGTKGRIYMVTDHFKCIIFYETDKSVSDADRLYIKFRAAHQYSPDQYCIKFKVVKHGVLPTEEVTNFSIDIVESNKFFFCVFLRKLKTVFM